MFENRNIVVLKTNFVLFLSAGTEHCLTREISKMDYISFIYSQRKDAVGAVLMSRRGKADQILGMSHPAFME